MLYIECPSCGWPLGQISEHYENEKDKICSNPNNTSEEVEELISKLLQSLNLRRLCCKARIMSYKDIVHDIIQIQR